LFNNHFRRRFPALSKTNKFKIEEEEESFCVLKHATGDRLYCNDDIIKTPSLMTS